MSNHNFYPTPPIAWTLLSALALFRIGTHLLSSTVFAYGYMNDELYYLACADHLTWGYVDHPPLSIVILAGLRAVLGDSLIALRLIPALAGGATVLLAGALAREMGGDRGAQALAALAAVVAPIYLAIGGFYSMNAFEPVFWGSSVLVLLRLLNGGSPRGWILLGVLLGLGLLNKISMLWLGLGIAVGLVVTPARRWIATPWPWLAGGIAVLIFVPHLVWQVKNGWPTLEFMRNATADKMVAKSPLTFVSEQLIVMNPAAVPLWIGGLVYLFAVPDTRHARPLGWIWVTVLLFLIASGTARSSYLAPAYLIPFAAGGVAVMRLASKYGWHWLPTTLAVAIGAAGMGAAPTALPLLPPRSFAAYSQIIGIQAPREQTTELGVLPLHFALRFGWKEVTEAVVQGVKTLDPVERARSAILAPSYSEAGALDFFGRDLQLPPVLCPHNSYWEWSREAAPFDVLVVIERIDEGERFDDEIRQDCASIEPLASVDCEFCLPSVREILIYACRGLRPSFDAFWQQQKLYR